MSKSRRGGHAQWAVVTGASSGFGSIFAEQLPKRELSPVLTGRDESRLAAARARIGKLTPGAEVELVIGDPATKAGVDPS